MLLVRDAELGNGRMERDRQKAGDHLYVRETSEYKMYWRGYAPDDDVGPLDQVGKRVRLI